MGVEDLDLKGLMSFGQAMERLPQGRAAVDLARKMGLWTTISHREVAERKRFPSKLSDMGPNELSDEHAHWAADFGRLVELAGALNAQMQYLKLTSKRARAAARSRVRRERLEAPEGQPAPKQPTVAELNDLAEEDPAVMDVDAQIAMVEMLLAHVNATREATTQYLASLSREISFRDAQMKARLY